MRFNYYLDKRVDRKNESAIRVSIPMPWRERVITTTGKKIYPNRWDKEKQRAKSTNCNSAFEDSYTINQYLTECEARVSQIRNDFQQKHGLLGLSNDLKQEFKHKVLTEGFPEGHRRVPENMEHQNVSKKKTFFDHLDDFVKERSGLNSWSEVTSYKYDLLKRHLYEFKSDISFDDFNKDTIGNFILFLRVEMDMVNSTIEKYWRALKSLINWGYENELHSQDAYKRFKLRLKKLTGFKPVVYLTWDEIQIMRKLSFSTDEQILEEVRDAFIFTCYTSLRYSDLLELKKTDIKEDTITIITQKTVDGLQIDLNNVSREILAKYQFHPYTADKALPVLSNQQMNDYLKVIAKRCGFNRLVKDVKFKGNEPIVTIEPLHKRISTHCGRRSFICNALLRNMDVLTVMKYTGHSTYASMKPYLDVTEKDRANTMRRIFDDNYEPNINSLYVNPLNPERHV